MVIEPGVTYVGTHFFSPDDQIDELVLPDAAITINEEAFSGSVIDRVIFPQSATDAAQYDFGYENAPFGNAVVHNLDLGGLGGFPNGFRFGYGDSALNLKDTVLIRRYLADWNVAIDEDAAAVDDDGEVTLQDVTLMNRYIAGGWNVELN